MDFFVVFGAVALTFVIGAMIIHRRSQAFKERLQAVEAARIKLQVRITEIEDDLKATRSRERELQDQVNRLLSERDNLVSLTVQKGSAKPRTAVDVLLAAGKLTPEGLQKATDYKQKTRSPYDIEEILVLLDLVSVQDIRSAAQQVAPK